MALTTCPECGGQVSTEAATCPHCGNVLKKEESKPVQQIKKEVNYYGDWEYSHEFYAAPVKRLRTTGLILKSIWGLCIIICLISTILMPNYRDDIFEILSTVELFAILALIFDFAANIFGDLWKCLLDYRIADWVLGKKYDPIAMIKALRLKQATGEKLRGLRWFGYNNFLGAAYIIQNRALAKKQNCVRLIINEILRVLAFVGGMILLVGFMDLVWLIVISPSAIGGAGSSALFEFYLTLLGTGKFVVSVMFILSSWLYEMITFSVYYKKVQKWAENITWGLPKQQN